MLTSSFNSQKSRVKAFGRIGPRMKKKRRQVTVITKEQQI